MTRAAAAVIVAVQAWLTASTAYLLGLLALALRPERARAQAGAPGPPLRFAVLVPAHDEEAGIAAAVSALERQDHPAASRETIVIADNCTDATAAVAAAAGATAWVRDDPAARGKGQALAWALDRLWASRPDVDAVAVVDADCRATPNLLSAFDARLRAGADAVQADYVVDNPGDSPTAALRHAGFALMHVVRPRGKERLGVSVGLFGTGMAFRADVLRAIPWSSFSVTEDVEYHLRLVESGRRVRYAGEAAVTSPMPTSDAAATQQQLRWESGNAALARRVGSILLAGAARGDAGRLHAAAERLVPPQTLLLGANALTTAAAVALGRRRAAAAGVLTGLGQAGYVLGGLRAAGAPPEVFRALRAAPALAARKLLLFGRIAAGRGATGWVRTARGGASRAG